MGDNDGAVDADSLTLDPISDEESKRLDKIAARVLYTDDLDGALRDAFNLGRRAELARWLDTLDRALGALG